MIELDNRTKNDIDTTFLEKIADKITDKDIELIFTNNDEMQKLNKTYKDVDKTTDVISFPMEQMPHAPLGSIIINIDKAQEKSQEIGHDVKDEITLLFIHGILHLAGYDHETDNGEMREKEKELIGEFDLPKSLIVRIEE